jgi:hypothetical protein
MEIDHLKVGRRITEHLHIKHMRECLIKDSASTAKGVEQRAETEVRVEAHTQSNLCTACIMVVTPIIAPKIAPST